MQRLNLLQQLQRPCLKAFLPLQGPFTWAASGVSFTSCRHGGLQGQAASISVRPGGSGQAFHSKRQPVTPMNQNPIPWQPGAGGLDKICLQTGNGAAAEVYRYGAHLTSWRTAAGREWVFLSQAAQFVPGKAIRGGVPIIFPQFNERGPGPRHGFARTQEWALAEAPDYSAGRVSCTFRLTANDGTRALWPHAFDAYFTVSVEDERLKMTLAVENTCTLPFQFTTALHTYLRVEDLQAARLAGLQGLSYWDNDGSNFNQRQLATKPELTFVGALDRVYFDSRQPLLLTDGAASLQISSEGFGDVVVWNPGPEAAAQMADMQGEEYRNMLCVEAARIDRPVSLQPGERWVGVQSLAAVAPY